MTNNEKTERRRALLARQNDRIEALEKELGIDIALAGKDRAEQALRSLRGGVPFGGTRAFKVAQYLNLTGFYDPLTDTNHWTGNRASRAAQGYGTIPGFGYGKADGGVS